MTIRKNIEFDELVRAQDILKNGFQKGVLTRTELFILAKYYSSIGITGIKLKKELIKFCKDNSAGFNEIIHRQTIDDALKMSEKYNMRISENVIITKKEMNIIRSLPMRYGKVLFIIIVTAKYCKEHPSKKIENYKLDNNKDYSHYKMRELVGMARLSMDESEILSMCKYFAVENNYIKPIEGKDYIYEVFCLDDSDEAEVVVRDMNNIISYFPPYCERCGKIIEKTGKRQKFCKDCWAEVYKELNRNRQR
jgi:hypothetical protein